MLLAMLGQSLGYLWAQEPNPNDTRGWSNRIEQALRDGNADRALEEINRAIAKSPELSQLYLIRGSVPVIVPAIDPVYGANGFPALPTAVE